MSQKRFTQALRQRGFDTTRTATQRQVLGLKLRNPAQSHASNPYND